MQYLKVFFDEVNSDCLGMPHLQFIWTPGQNYGEKEAAVDNIMVQIGARTLDEVREKQGDKPYPNGLGSKPLVGGQLLENILNGTAQAGGDGMNLPSLNAQRPNNDFRLSLGDDEPGPYELSIRSMKAELEEWQKFAIARIGKKAKREFETKTLPNGLSNQIRSKLSKAATVDATKAVFEEARLNLGRRTRTPSVELTAKELEAEYQKELREILEGFSSRLGKI
jgi:hypothetical protein